MRRRSDQITEQLRLCYNSVNDYFQIYSEREDICAIAEKFRKRLYEKMLDRINPIFRDTYDSADIMRDYLQKAYREAGLAESFQEAQAALLRHAENVSAQPDTPPYVIDKIIRADQKAAYEISAYANTLRGWDDPPGVRNNILMPCVTLLYDGQELLRRVGREAADPTARIGLYALACKCLEDGSAFLKILGKTDALEKLCEQMVNQEGALLRETSGKSGEIDAYIQDKKTELKTLMTLPSRIIASGLFPVIERLAVNIVGTNLLPPALQNAAAADFVADCFLNRRADTMKEAINLYYAEAREQANRESIVRDFQKTVKAQQDEFNRRIRAITRDVDSFKRETGYTLEQMGRNYDELAAYSDEIAAHYNRMVDTLKGV